MCPLFHVTRLRPAELFGSALPTAKWSMLRYGLLSP
jgi:hypothetical protein